MALTDIRDLFVTLSGRSDLDAASDAGADVYIRAGSKALDMEADQDRNIKYYTTTISAEGYTITLTECRAVLKVLWWDSTNTKWRELDPVGYDEILDDYTALESTSSGTPVKWARDIIHQDPNNQAATPTMGTMGIIIMPPTSAEITVKVVGKFHEKPLTENTDVNYWSEVHPQLLVYAALRELETSYRNTQGYEDWNRRIKDYLLGLSGDVAEATFKYPAEMDG